MSMTGKPEGKAQATPKVRDAIDAHEVEALKKNPEDEDAQLDVALDETFPSSDPPSTTQPGHAKDIPDSSGYDPGEEERRRHRR